MPLEKTTISLPFTAGVDTKTDSRLSAKPSRVEGMTTQGGTLAKRFGTKTLTATIDTGGSQTVGEALFNFESELVRINSGVAYGLTSSVNEWVTKPGGGNGFLLSSTTIQRNTRTQTEYDQCSANGITVFAWTEAAAPQQGIHVAAYDEATGAYYRTGATAETSTSAYAMPRCVALGGTVVILISDITNGIVSSLVYSTAAPTTAPTLHTNLFTDLYTGTPGSITGDTQRLDAISYDGSYGLGAYVYGATGAGFKSFWFDANGAIVTRSGASTHTWAAESTGNGISVLHINRDTPGSIYFFWIDAFANVTSYKAVDSSWNLLKAKTALYSAVNFGITSAEATSGQLTVILCLGLTGPLRVAVVSSSAVVSASAQISGTNGVGLQTEAIVVGGSVVFGICSPHSAGFNTQPTAWIMDSSGNPIARFLTGLAALISPGANAAARLSRPFAISPATNFLFGERGRLAYSSVSGTTIDTTPSGLTRIAIKSATANQLPINRISGNVHIGGALPRVYDGQQVTEDGIPVPPQTLTKGATTGSGGSLSAGTYQMKALFSWVDAHGQLVRSAVSPALSFTASANDKQRVAATVLPLSSRDLLSQGTTVEIEFYRTAANGSLFYRDSSVASPTFNSTSAVSVNFDAQQSDAALIVGELLYVTGGVNDWLSPPPYSCSVVHKSRLIIAGLEDPYSWRGSSEVIDKEAIRFNEAWGGFVPRETGPIVALASMDGSLFLFTTLAVYMVIGDGPDLLGSNNWPEPQIVTSANEGVTDVASVVSAGEGIFFKSQRGFMMLGRGLDCPYIGADVEAYNGLTVRAATVRPELEQVWFHLDDGSDVIGAGEVVYGTWITHNGGVVLVYDYHYRQWEVLPNYGAQDACYYQGQYTRVRSDGAVIQEVPNSWTDGTTHYTQVMETNWIKTAGVQGFQRLRFAELMGLYGSPCTITWDAAYNYDPTYSSSDTTTTTISSQAQGTAVQIRRHLRIQKCEAVKFRFTITTSSGTGQGMGLTDLSLEFGVKKGAFKLPAAQSL